MSYFKLCTCWSRIEEGPEGPSFYSSISKYSCALRRCLHVPVFSRSLEVQRTSASATIAPTSCFINVPHTKSKLKKKKFSHLSIKSNPDLQPIWTIKTCQSSIHDFRSSSILTAISHRYIHLKGILVPVFVDKNPHHGFLDISVDFIKPEERPTSDLELVFKDGAGDKQQSKKFKKKDFIYWSLDMSVHVVSIIVLRY